MVVLALIVRRPHLARSDLVLDWSYQQDVYHRLYFISRSGQPDRRHMGSMKQLALLAAGRVMRLGHSPWGGLRAGSRRYGSAEALPETVRTLFLIGQSVRVWR
jgi:hypothetical protein